MAKRWTRRNALRSLGTIGTLSIAGCLGSSNGQSWDIKENLAVTNAQQYNSPGCGCCKQYASYFRENADGKLTETVPEDIYKIKRKHNIPQKLQGCHTLVLDDYFVEGHVPLEVVSKLRKETPDIDGVALPGMPAGSPGMGGEKRREFVVYAIGGEQGTEKYMTI